MITGGNLPKDISQYGNVTWASWCLKLSATRLYYQKPLWTNNKEQIKAPYHWPFMGNSGFPSQIWKYENNCEICLRDYDRFWRGLLSQCTRVRAKREQCRHYYAKTTLLRRFGAIRTLLLRHASDIDTISTIPNHMCVIWYWYLDESLDLTNNKLASVRVMTWHRLWSIFPRKLTQV